MSRRVVLLIFVLVTLGELWLERERRRAAWALRAEALRTTIEALRADYHPKQGAFCRSPAKRRAAKCTRRAGKTRGGCRETFARCLENRERWLYCAATRDEAKRRAWRTDTRDGWADLVERFGLKAARTRLEFDKRHDRDVLINDSELTIDFRNGSQLAIFAADRAEDQDKLRGGQKDGVWIDEAQIFPALAYFVDDVCAALLKKPGGDVGELWLTGTPSRSLAGLFYEITKEPDQGPRKPGWEVHEWSVVDNPYFGATAEERWDTTAGAELATKGWDIADPPPVFIREWLGKWAVGDALYVYAVNRKPPPEFAPSRVNAATGAYDHAAAFADLPEYTLDEEGRRRRIRWYFALGADFGFSPAAFAWVLWAFALDVPDIYEMGSWKKHELLPDAIRKHLVAVWMQCRNDLAVCVGDAGGAMAKSTIIGWRESTGLPIEAADKADKWTWIEHYNGELYAGNIHYRIGSLLLAEQKNLQKKPGKAKPGETDAEVKWEEWPERILPDGTRCGNDCSDGGLYSSRGLVTRRIELAAPPKSQAERDAREAKRMTDAMARSVRDTAREDEYGG